MVGSKFNTRTTPVSVRIDQALAEKFKHNFNVPADALKLFIEYASQPGMTLEKVRGLLNTEIQGGEARPPQKIDPRPILMEVAHTCREQFLIRFARNDKFTRDDIERLRDLALVHTPGLQVSKTDANVVLLQMVEDNQETLNEFRFDIQRKLLVSSWSSFMKQGFSNGTPIGAVISNHLYNYSENYRTGFKGTSLATIVQDSFTGFKHVRLMPEVIDSVMIEMHGARVGYSPFAPPSFSEEQISRIRDEATREMESLAAARVVR